MKHKLSRRVEQLVARLKQSFQNRTDRAQIINLELSTARFRLEPGEVLILNYDPEDVQDELGASLRIELIADGDHVELVVWTCEEEMFFPDGRPAPRNYDLL